MISYRTIPAGATQSNTNIILDGRPFTCPDYYQLITVNCCTYLIVKYKECIMARLVKADKIEVIDKMPELYPSCLFNYVSRSIASCNVGTDYFNHCVYLLVLLMAISDKYRGVLPRKTNN